MQESRFCFIPDHGVLWTKLGDLRIAFPRRAFVPIVAVGEDRVKSLEREGLATRDDSKVPPERFEKGTGGLYDDAWDNFSAWQWTLAMNAVMKPGPLMAEIDKIFAEAGCNRRVRSPWS